MNKFLNILAALTISTSVAAKEEIPVITRLSPVAPIYQGLNLFIQNFNKTQDKYEFRISTVPGAYGEPADQKALQMGKFNEKVVWFGPTSTFTLNRYQVGNTYDRDNDFILLNSFTISYMSLVVSPNSNINSFSDFLNTLSKKEKVFRGTDFEIGPSELLNTLIEKKYGIHSSQLKYKDRNEVNRALIIGEIDYAITPYALTKTVKEILNTGTGINSGKAIGFNEFYLYIQNAFAVPKELKSFGEEITPWLKTSCENTNLDDFLARIMYDKICYGNSELKKHIAEQLELIKNNF